MAAGKNQPHPRCFCFRGILFTPVSLQIGVPIRSGFEVAQKASLGFWNYLLSGRRFCNPHSGVSRPIEGQQGELGGRLFLGYQKELFLRDNHGWSWNRNPTVEDLFLVIEGDTYVGKG